MADICVVVQSGGMLVRNARSGLVEGAEVVTCMQLLTMQVAWGAGATFPCKQSELGGFVGANLLAFRPITAVSLE